MERQASFFKSGLFLVKKQLVMVRFYKSLSLRRVEKLLLQKLFNFLNEQNNITSVRLSHILNQ